MRRKKSLSLRALRHQVEPLEKRQLLTAISSGQRLTGAIAIVGQQDSYTFDANAGDTVIVAMGDTSGSNSFTAQVDLRSPDGSLLGTQIGNTGASVDALNLAQSGTYTIVAHEQGDNFTGAYAVSMLRIPATQQVDADSAPISSGETRSGTIDLGDLDIYTFNASSGDTVLVALGDTAGSNGTSAHLQVYAPNGALIGSVAANTGGSVNLSNLALTGTYSIVVREQVDDASYTYNVTMLRLPSTQSASVDSGPISSGQRLTGTIDLGDLDIYTFNANAGDSVLAIIGETSVSNATFVQIDLYGPNGILLGTSSSNTGTSVNLLNAPITGTYYMVARELNDDAAMTYAVTMIRLPSTQIVDADSGPIASGQRLAGTIDPGDADVYTFTANAGDTFLAAVGETAANNSTVVDLEVYAPNGALIGSSNSNTGTSVNITNTAQTGTYYIVVREQFDDIGYPYAVSMLHFPAAQVADVDSGPIVSGDTRTGTIDTGDLDVYTFSANVGDTAIVALGDTAGSNSSTVLLEVYAPNGSLLGSSSNNTGTSVDLSNLPLTGTYYIVAREQSDDFGYNYAVTLHHLPGVQAPSDDSGPIVSGQTVTGNVTLGDPDIYTFTANAGDTVLISLGDTSGSNSSSALLQLYAPNGSLIASGFNNLGTSVDVQHLAQSGTYYIVAREQFDDFFYSYALTMLRLPAVQQFDTDSAVINSGQRRSGVITLGDLDVYPFVGNVGDAVAVVIGDISGSNSSIAQVQLYAPNGAKLADNNGNLGAGIDLQNLPLSGTYYIVAREQFDDFPMPYAVSFFRNPTNQFEDGESGPIASGQMRSGMIDFGDMDQYTFTANAGDSFSVIAGDTSGSNSSFVQIQVFAPNGAPVGSSAANIGTSVDVISVPLTGTYTILVREQFDDFPMPYSLSLVHVPDTQTVDPRDNDGGVLSTSETRTGSISLGDSDIYTLNLAAGTPLTIQMNRLTGGTFFAPRIQLYAANGSIVSDQSAAANATITVPSVPVTGTYYLVARETFDDGVGTYTLGINATAAADTRAPTVNYAQYDFDSVPPRILLSVNEAITLPPTPANVTIQNLTTAQTIPTASYTTAFNAASNQIVITLTGFAASQPADGNYRVTLATGSITDGINPLAAPAVADFFIYAGDFNRDRKVDDKDLYVVAYNWMSPGDRFSQGDFNRDGIVNLLDLTLVAQRWQMTLTPAAPPPAQPIAISRTPTRTATRLVQMVL